MEEQLSGLLPSKFDFLPEFLENFSEEALQLSAGFKHNCEAISFQLSYRLQDSLIANVSMHTFVYYKGEIWIDVYAGIIIDKELMKVLPTILSAWKRVQNQVRIHHRVHYIEPSVWNDNELADWIIQEIELGDD